MRTVLLTGASTGLGLAIARLLVKSDMRVLLTARESSIQRFAADGIEENERIHFRPLDVTNASQRNAIVDEANRKWGGIDVLINNAGITYRAVVEHVTEEERLAQMNVNFRSPMDLIRLVLPSMRAKRAGRILTVSSVGGMMAMPTMAVYSASKFALEGAHEALWYEAKPWNIKVSLVQPGFIHSDAFQRVYYTVESDRAEREEEAIYHGHYANMAPFIARLMKWSPATPESVAKIVMKTMTRNHPPLRMPATIDAWGFSLLRRLLPRRVYHNLLYRSLPKVNTWGEKSLPPPRG